MLQKTTWLMLDNRLLRLRKWRRREKRASGRIFKILIETLENTLTLSILQHLKHAEISESDITWSQAAHHHLLS